MRKLEKDNPFVPMNKHNLENLIEECEMDTYTLLANIKSVSESIAIMADRAERNLHIIERLKDLQNSQENSNIN